MKLTKSNRRTNALTLVELLVILAAIALLAALLLPALSRAKKQAAKIRCVSCLMQIGSASRIWAGDHSDKYPDQISIEQGGVMELAATGNVAAVFQVMSNELVETRVLVCPADTDHIRAKNWTTSLSNSNVSYFIGLDAADVIPAAIHTGDDNFEIKGVPVKSGVLELSTNSPISWTVDRHRFVGNIALADGSVQTTTDSGLTNLIVEQNDLNYGFTNRFRIAIP